MNIQPFKTIFFDIAGTCNARCTYCNTGKYAEDKGGFISLEAFQETIDRLISQNLLSREYGINLYCWGEPFLHPKLPEILRYLNKVSVPYRFSTNASRIPLIDDNFVEGLDGIVFSMSGFSQESYSKIHGFKFEEIKNNIIKIVSDCRKYGYQGAFTISYHTYQFNTGELFKCEQFSSKYRINFRPVNAIQNNWSQIELNAQGQLPADIHESISRDLLYDHFSEIVLDAKQGCSQSFYCSYIDDMLVIDENSNVLQCCQVPSGTSHSPGNILSSTWHDIAESRSLSSPVCQKCIGLGMAQYFKSAYKEPDFYASAVVTRPKPSDYLDPRYWSRKYPRLRGLKGHIRNYLSRF